MSKKGRRGAFTLVELLVVIAIIGVLVGLLLPAVQYAREAARRMQCSNSLRQFVLAAMNFETQSQKLPANRQLRASASGNVTVGWVFDLLPFMEEQNVYDLLKRNPADTVALNKRIPLLTCPSDPTIQTSPDMSYQVNGGCPNNPALATLDYPANGVSDDLTNFLPAVRATLAGCKDGTTQTIFYVENYNAQTWSDANFEYLQCVLWMPCDVANVPFGFGEPPAAWGLYTINEGGFDILNSNAYSRPSSEHSSGFQAAFVGGNTRYFTDSMNYQVYAQLLSSDGSRTNNPYIPEGGVSPWTATDTEVQYWQKTILLPQTYE